ncbi:MAG: EAL domain-containing protein [Eubacteriales bacterium]|nr:EAL domain-containing protein [Eubacteriales bacterium]
MDSLKLKDKVLSEIVQMLELEGTFTEVVYNILKKSDEYLNTGNASLMQISEDGKSVGTIIDYKSKMDSDNVQSVFSADECGSACVTMPIYINETLAMYYAVSGRGAEENYSKEQLQFMKDVAKLIQSIAQTKVTRNSLLSSYEVLREILSSIDAGIIVCNRYDGTVFFENDMARDTQEIRRTIKECLEIYFSRQESRDEVKRPIEHYDAESGLWFETKFADMTWIDGSKVVVCTTNDITQKKKNQQKIEYQAHNDFLTGLYNRMKCESDLRMIIKSAMTDGLKGLLLFIDLDDFKQINDGLGHEYGDVLLQQIAAGLQGVPGIRNHCYRMGGDEFVIIMTPEIYNDRERIIKNIIAMFNKPWNLMETEYYCTMSMGAAIFPTDSADVHGIIRLADIAMYESKKTGKNRFSYYDNSQNRNTIKRLDIESNMRQAIANEINEFVVFYQPVVDVKTQRTASCEALVRWNSKALGFMGPGDFIPLAEYLGLITSIGDYVLETACRQCRYWNDNGYPDFRINVNLSVVQLLQKDVVDNVSRIMEKTGVNPANIVLEITESFAINDMERVLGIIKGLKRLGPKIALDDFGTGYSSLNYIKQLPLDIIKVDKTFIDGITEDEYAQAFIRLIVELSNTIDTKIVVEGVETQEQFELLKSLGVNYIQGYYFGKPVMASEFEIKNLKGRMKKNDYFN